MVVKFDITHFPLIKVEIISMDSQKAVDSFIEKFDKVFELAITKQQKFGIIFDAKKIGNVSLANIKQISNFMTTREEKSKVYINRTAIVITSWLSRKLLGILFSLKKPVTECKIFKTTNEGLKWVVSANATCVRKPQNN